MGAVSQNRYCCCLLVCTGFLCLVSMPAHFFRATCPKRPLATIVIYGVARTVRRRSASSSNLFATFRPSSMKRRRTQQVRRPCVVFAYLFLPAHHLRLMHRLAACDSLDGRARGGMRASLRNGRCDGGCSKDVAHCRGRARFGPLSSIFHSLLLQLMTWALWTC